MRKPLEIVLTPNAIKARMYAQDRNFTDALATVQGYWGCRQRLCDHLWNTSALILRPDAIVGGQARAVFPMLRQHGLIPAAVLPLQVGVQQVTDLWRYQLNVATPQRRELLQRIMTMGQSAYILLRDHTQRTSAPSTVHLTYLKGTAVISRRKPGHLRTVAGPAVSTITSYVHVSDDPADMLREMDVLFDRPAQLQLLAQLDARIDRTWEALHLVHALERRAPINALIDDAPLPADAQLAGLARRWREIVAQAKVAPSFITGESYAGKDAIIPDDKELSLPLDPHLIFADLGPR